MRIKFLGAAETVTGSKHLIDTDNSRVLIDCGLFQERDNRHLNWEAFAVDPKSIEAVILTHAHTDHCAYLPKLIKDGFRGKIYCTAPTAAITKLALLDSAHLQESDAEFKRRRHKKEGRKGTFPEVPLYTVEDAQKVFYYLKSISYEQSIKITSDVSATFYDAGHILGSAMIELKVRKGKSETVCVFSGDIGRWNKPILQDPHIFKRADYVIMEATYGDRVNEEGKDGLEKLAKIINETHKAGGNIVIPTFAIGRTQELLYDLNKLLKEDRIPHLMTFVDGPMAIGVTEVFKQYPEFFDQEAQEILRQQEDFFKMPLLKMTRTPDESKAINHIKGTVIIMAGSGMCTGGRIKHHLARNISRPESTILFAGFQSKGTLGREILEKPKQVRILGEQYSVNARIEKINGFSAHADQTELLKWITGLTDPAKKVFIVHSEKETAQKFSEILKKKIDSEIIVPQYLEEFVL